MAQRPNKKGDHGRTDNYKINMIIAKIVYSIVISLMYPLRRAIQIPENNKGDLLSPHNEKLMI